MSFFQSNLRLPVLRGLTIDVPEHVMQVPGSLGADPKVHHTKSQQSCKSAFSTLQLPSRSMRCEKLARLLGISMEGLQRREGPVCPLGVKIKFPRQFELRLIPPSAWVKIKFPRQFELRLIPPPALVKINSHISLS